MSGQDLYLGMVIVAFTVFGGVLFGVSSWVSMKT
jgi:hypothetical protein